MKTLGFALIGTFLFLISVSRNEKNYPEVKEISLKETTLEEDIMKTELYKKTITVEDTITETAKLIKELKNETY